MKTLYACLVCLLPFVASAEVLHRLGFENGKAEWTPYWNEVASPDRLSVVQDPVMEGRYALKATVVPGDLVANGARAEVVLAGTRANYAYEGDELWYKWGTYFPADWEQEAKWHVFTQWHQSLDYGMGSPPVAFCIDKYGYMYLTRMSGYYDSLQQWDAGTLWRAPLIKGRWIEFVMHIKWSRDWNVGFIELWVDGVQVVPKTFTANLDSDGMVYMKQGLYRDRTTSITQTVYHDGMIVATTKEDVMADSLVPEISCPPLPPVQQIPCQAPPEVASPPHECSCPEPQVVVAPAPNPAADESSKQCPQPDPAVCDSPRTDPGTGGCGSGGSSSGMSLAIVLGLAFFFKRTLFL